MNLRERAPIHIDSQNKNRYRIVLNENDGTKTSYCFGVPIYNNNTEKLIDYRITYKDDVGTFIGSNAKIVIDENITLKNRDGVCTLTFMAEKPVLRTPEKCVYKNAEVIPTTNGVLCKVDCSDKIPMRFKISTDRVFLNVRANTKYFSIMNTKHIPFVTVSCIGVADESGEIVAGANVNCRKISDREYELTFSSASSEGKRIYFEINAQESKLFQDTTVESNNPRRNNAFGGIAFIGNSVTYGEMWLYSRPMLSLISDLYDIPIKKAMVHFPRHNLPGIDITAYRISRRFCSFGSKWDNKVEAAEMVANSFMNGKYQSIDITQLITHKPTGFLSLSEGFILKPLKKEKSFSVISTGDSFYAPPILEIRHK